MFLFILAVVTSAMVSIFMRASKKHVNNQTTMLAFNYAMCTVLALLGTQHTQLVPAHSGTPLTLGLGLINGFFYLGGFVMLQWTIGKNGVALSATFMKLGVMVPTLMAVFLFGETPGALQIIGIVIAVVAIIIFNFEKDAMKDGSRKYLLLLLLLLSGFTDSMAKIYDQVGNVQGSDFYLLVTFFVAFLFALLMVFRNKNGVSMKDCGYGLLIGVPNYYSARFLLLALRSVDADLAYPLYSVATIILITIVGVIVFKEKLSLQKIKALILVVVAICLLNI